MSIAFTTKEHLVEQHLVWLYHQSDAEMGIQSSWGAQTNFNKMNGNICYDPYHDGILNAVSKRRQIEQALASLPRQQFIVMLYNYASLPSQFPASLIYVFCKTQELDLTATATALWQSDFRSLLHLCEQKRSGKATLTEQSIIRRLIIQSKQAYLSSIEAIYPLLKKVK